jgi:hypothetical protein
MGARNLEVRSNSQVVWSHIRGQSEVHGEKMIQYLNKVHEIQSNFDRVVRTKIHRENNIRADALSKIGPKTGPEVKTFSHKIMSQKKPYIISRQETMEIDEESTDPEWAT